MYLSQIKGDKVIWAIVVLLSIISMLAVYSSISSLAYKSGSTNQEIILIKHAITMLLGLSLMFFVHKLKFTYYSRIAQLAYWVAIPLLALTLILGVSLNDASRWLVVPGLGISFQTSDFAKLALIMFVARLLAKKQDQIKDFKSTFIPVLFPVFVICGLILPANFSTAAVLFATCLVLMFIGRVNINYLFALVGTGILLFSVFVLIALNSADKGRIGTWKNRIENFMSGGSANTDSNYQVNQAKIAIATGGILGKGPGGSTQRNFLPHPYSDFIYAFIIEEYGLAGGLFVMFLYVLLLLRTIRIANNADNDFGAFLALGCCFLLVFQAMINMAVAVNLIPVTGQPLPFISKGGTSVIFTGIAIGMILSVSQSVKTEPEVNNLVKQKGADLAAV
ncbi:MAG: FtsW/RodA/SpoVE family cell cycle protein [Bacteroidetes bacterium]|nr:FtsW/RodA/SpoVE family cell cycle protein [Bacteroidota bacterium]HET6245584.1 FtsW/RodA/SpoVE family cell cycle protein [Bacteroidia bacterium]